MARLRLIHWHPEEARERAARLRAAGYTVDHAPLTSSTSLSDLRKAGPDAFVIDLGRLPSHGRDVAMALRQTKSTRHIPLVFVGGDPDKVDRIRHQLPDAVFTSWSRIRGAVRQALTHPPSAPIVPASALAGYSGTPLVKKLGMKSGARIWLAGAPPDFEALLAGLPAGVTLSRRAVRHADLIVWFVSSVRELDLGLSRMAARTGGDGLWIAWPKKASGIATDLSETIVRGRGLAAGLVDYKICAIDRTWSGLKFTRRRAD